MPGLASLACVEATRDDGAPSTRYYLSSARLTPERFAAAVRSHWAIENSLHWVLDVTFDEDAARNRADNGPENLAIPRRLTLNLPRTARPKLPKTQALRMLRRLRSIHHRPNAIALLLGRGGVDAAGRNREHCQTVATLRPQVRCPRLTPFAPG